MLNNDQKYPESFRCSCCKTDISKCALHLMPSDITIKEAEIVTRSNQQRFKLTEEDYRLLFYKFRDSSLKEKVITISCFVCGKIFCKLSSDQSAWVMDVLETNSMKFCRV